METSSGKNQAVTGLLRHFAVAHYAHCAARAILAALLNVFVVCKTTTSAVWGRIPWCIFGAGELPCQRKGEPPFLPKFFTLGVRRRKMYKFSSSLLWQRGWACYPA